MAQKYAFYRLRKMPREKKFVPEVVTVEKSKGTALRELEMYYEDCLVGPVWLNKKISEFVSYEMYYDKAYVPNEANVQDENGILERKLIGVYNRKPIYFVDIYPNPYSYYILHKKGDEFTLEGIR